MRYSVFREQVTGAPPLTTKTLVASGSVAGAFAPATFEGWNRFFGSTGWSQNNSFVFYSTSPLSNKDVIEVDKIRYSVTGVAKGRIRNTYFMVRYV